MEQGDYVSWIIQRFSNLHPSKRRYTSREPAEVEAPSTAAVAATVATTRVLNMLKRFFREGATKLQKPPKKSKWVMTACTSSEYLKRFGREWVERRLRTGCWCLCFWASLSLSVCVSLCVSLSVCVCVCESHSLVSLRLSVCLLSCGSRGPAHIPHTHFTITVYHCGPRSPDWPHEFYFTFIQYQYMITGLMVSWVGIK